MWSNICGDLWVVHLKGAKYTSLDGQLTLELNAEVGDDGAYSSLQVRSHNGKHVFKTKYPAKTTALLLEKTLVLFQEALDAGVITREQVNLKEEYAKKSLSQEIFKSSENTLKVEEAIVGSISEIGVETFKGFMDDRFGGIESLDVGSMNETISTSINYLGDDFQRFWQWARRVRPEIHNTHSKEVIGDLSAFYEDDYPKFHQWSSRYSHGAKSRQLKSVVKEKYGTDLLGLELSNDKKNLFAVLLPDSSEPGRFRMAQFSDIGLIGHVTKDSYEEVLQEAIDSGYRNLAEGSMQRLSEMESFTRGNDYLARLDGLKSGKISWETFKAINLFETTPAPSDKPEIGRLKLTEENQEDWEIALELKKGDVNAAKAEMLGSMRSYIDELILEASPPQDSISDMDLSLNLIDEYLSQGVTIYDKKGVDKLRKKLAEATNQPKNAAAEESHNFIGKFYGADELSKRFSLASKKQVLKSEIDELRSTKGSKKLDQEVAERKIAEIDSVIGMLEAGQRLIDIELVLTAQTPPAGSRDAATGVESPLESVENKHDYLATKIINASHKSIRTAFTKINSLERAAHVAAAYRKSAQEYLIAIITDNDDEIIQVIEHTKGDTGSSLVDAALYAGSVIDVPGSANVWMAHNHPSGVRAVSEADYAITKRIAGVLDGSKVKYRGHTILTGGRDATSFDYDRKTSEFIIADAGVRKYSVDVTERTLRSRKTIGESALGNRESAESFIKKIGHENAAVLLNTQLLPVGVINLNHGEIGKLKGNGGVDRLLSAIHRTNAESVILKISDPSSEMTNDAINLVSFLHSAKIKTRDWFQTRDEGQSYAAITLDHSFSKQEQRLEGRGYYKKYAPENSPGSKLENVKTWVSQVEADTGVRIQVVADETMLPVRIQRALKNPVSGIYDMATKTPYVVASQIDNEEHAIKVAIHEGLGHSGVIEFLERNAEFGGLSVEAVLDDIYSDIGPNQIGRIVKGYEFDLTTTKGRRESVLEYIAHIAESNEGDKSVLHMAETTQSMLNGMYDRASWGLDEVVGLIESSRCYSLMERVARSGAKEDALEERAGRRKGVYVEALNAMGGRLRQCLLNNPVGLQRLAGGEYFNGFDSSLIISHTLSNKGIGSYAPNKHLSSRALSLDLTLPMREQEYEIQKRLKSEGVFDKFIADSYEEIITGMMSRGESDVELQRYIGNNESASLNNSIGRMSGLEFYGYLAEKHEFKTTSNKALNGSRNPAEYLRKIGVDGLLVRPSKSREIIGEFISLTDTQPTRPNPNIESARAAIYEFQESQLVSSHPLEANREFKEWIKKSKAVNDSGNPQVVYSKALNGFSGLGEGPIQTSPSIDRISTESKGSTIPLYLKAESPFYAKIGAALPSYDEIKAQGFDSIKLRQEDGGDWIVFDSSQARLAFSNNGNLIKDAPDFLEKKAYHGSPYKFDRFNLSAIGSGEGAQAYGWGIYLAGDKEVGKFYQKALAAAVGLGIPASRRITDFPSTREWAAIQEATKAFNTTLSAYSLGSAKTTPALWSNYYQFYNAMNEISEKDRSYYLENKNAIDEQVKLYRDQLIAHDPLISEGDIQNRLGIIGALDLAKPYTAAYRSATSKIEEFGGKGYLYEVSIPTEDNLLDWDLPLSDMSEDVVKSLIPVVDYLRSKPLTDNTLNKIKDLSITGEEIYRYLSAELSLDHGVNISPEGKELASIALGGEGISGLRYFDGNTRHQDDKKEHNYVIWDLQAIESIREYAGERAAKIPRDDRSGSQLKVNPLEGGEFLKVVDLLGLDSSIFGISPSTDFNGAEKLIGKGVVAIIDFGGVKVLENSIQAKVDVEKLLLGVTAKDQNSELFERSHKQAYSAFLLEMGQLDGLRSSASVSGINIEPHIDYTKEMLQKGGINQEQRISIVVDEYIAQAILGENYPAIKERERSAIKGYVNNMRNVFSEFGMDEIKQAQSSEIIHLMKQANLSRVVIESGKVPEMIIPAASGILYYKWQKAIERELVNAGAMNPKETFRLVNEMRAPMKEAFMNSKDPVEFSSSAEVKACLELLRDQAKEKESNKTEFNF